MGGPIVKTDTLDNKQKYEGRNLATESRTIIYTALESARVDKKTQDAFAKRSTGLLSKIRIRENISKPFFSDDRLNIPLHFFEKYSDRPLEFLQELLPFIESGLKSSNRFRNLSDEKQKEKLDLFVKISAKVTVAINYREYVPIKEEMSGDVFTTPSGINIPVESKQLYETIDNAGALGLSLEAFHEGYSQYKNAVKDGLIKPGRFLIVDFNKHDSQNRFFVLDFENMDLIHGCQVTHGSRSDLDSHHGWVDNLTNIPEDHTSSKGLYVYSSLEDHSEYGMVVRLLGLYNSNSNAKNRGILVHRRRPNQRYSWGCFAISEADADKIGLPLGSSTNTIGDWNRVGLYAYYNKNVQNHNIVSANKKVISVDRELPELVNTLVVDSDISIELADVLFRLNSRDSKNTLKQDGEIKISYDGRIPFKDQLALTEFHKIGIRTTLEPLGDNKWNIVFESK